MLFRSKYRTSRSCPTRIKKTGVQKTKGISVRFVKKAGFPAQKTKSEQSNLIFVHSFRFCTYPICTITFAQKKSLPSSEERGFYIRY